MSTSDTEFDEAVKKALEKWPNVPNCFGWISLSRRGQWLIKNKPITHARAIEFLGRNYAHDMHGRWFIQNGPQRVFCDLEYTPLIYSLNPDHSLFSHTGTPSGKILEIVIDDEGNLLIRAEQGIGLLDDRDLSQFCDRLGTTFAAEHANWFDFDYVRGKNAQSEQLELMFLGQPVALLAEFKKNIEKRYLFTRSPQPLDNDN